MKEINKIIVEAFEKEFPVLYLSIKILVESGESRANFDAFAKRAIPDYKTSATYRLALIAFDYYKAKTKEDKDL